MYQKKERKRGKRANTPLYVTMLAEGMKRMRKLFTLSRMETMNGMIQKNPCREKIKQNKAETGQ